MHADWAVGSSVCEHRVWFRFGSVLFTCPLGRMEAYVDYELLLAAATC